MPKILSNTIQAHIFAFKENDAEPFFLLLQRSENTKPFPHIWQVITGMIDINETAIEATLREIKEETNLSAINIWTIPYISNYFITENDEIHFSPVFGIQVNYAEQIQISFEHQDYKWCR